jgi:predicted TPR repeat methyltransferase
LASLYGRDYFHGAEYGDYVGDKTALQTNFAGRIEEIGLLPGISEHSRLYEIGCAYGFFLEMVQGRFKEVSGIDISTDAIAYARDVVGVNASVGDFLETEVPFNPDIICMWDVVEHLAKPEKVIERAAQTLTPGGYICITTGDIGSLMARVRGPKWRMIHPPTHLHYFDNSTLIKVLANHGMERVSLTYPPVVRTVGTILHGVLRLRFQAEALYRKLSRLPGQNISIPINFYDIMFLVARKAG